MPAADPCRRVLTPTEEAALFAPDALRAARHVMSGIPADAADEAYLAVFAVLAVAAMFPEMEGGGRVGASTIGASDQAR